MRHIKKSLIVVTALLGISAAYVSASVKTGQPAPDFTVTDSQGQTRHLSDYKGKLVVLEWFNNGCPFVRKHYDSNNMQSLQERYTAKDVIWLTVLSSAKGKQGYADAAEANKQAKENHSHATAMLLDSEGKIAELYGAKTTPHMFVINKEGQLIYQGAIDDKPSTEQADVKGARNYVAEALDGAMAGKTLAVSETKSYGCSVKYKG